MEQLRKTFCKLLCSRLWDFLASPPFDSAVSQSLHSPVSTRHVYESLPLFSIPPPPISSSSFLVKCIQQRQRSKWGGWLSPLSSDGGRRGFGICRDSDRRKERLLSPPPISQCNKMRQLQQNSVEFIFFCWKLSSGHLNARAEGSRKGEKEEARILSPPSSAKRRVAAPSAVGGEGRSSRRGRCKKEEEEEGRKRFFVLPSLAPPTMIQSLLEERGERRRGIFSRCCHDSRNF